MKPPTKLTLGERLVLERRRAGETQAEAAAAYGVSRYRFRAWEASTAARWGDDAPDGAPWPALGALAPHEACYVLRRRAGLSSAALADRLGVTEWWLTQMEQGREPAARLVDWWRGRRGVS